MIDPKEIKVLVITEVFAPEEFLINDLVFSWRKQGILVSVLTRNPSYPFGKVLPGYRNRLFQKEFINDVPVFRVQFIPGYKNSMLLKILNYLWNMTLGLLWAIKNGGKFDSIFICQTGPLTFSTIGILVKKIYKKKVTIWTQDIWPETVFAFGLAKNRLPRKILEKFVEWVYSNCDNITVSCPGYIPMIKKYCPLKNIQFIPQWSLTSKLPDQEESHREINYPGKFNFVFAGNIGKVQNLENVIAGFELFLQTTSDKDTWLNLIGDGSHLNYLVEQVGKKHIGNVKFWGRLNSAEMPYFYDKSDVLLISLENKPVFNLTIPAKFQSYLNAEKPIFGVINGEIADLITVHNLGWVASPDNIQEISNSFLEITSCKPEVLIEKTTNTNSLLAEQFNRKKIIQKFTDLVFNDTSTDDSVLSNKKSKYFFNLFLFIFLYKIGEYTFNYFEKTVLFSTIFDRLYYVLSFFITNISVKLYSLFYTDIYSTSNFFIFINNAGTIQMMHGCTGLMQLFQIFFILLFFPLTVRRKILFVPVSFFIILFAAILHYIMLIPVAYSIPDHFTIFHNIISRVIFYMFFFINFVLWNNSSGTISRFNKFRIH